MVLKLSGNASAVTATVVSVLEGAGKSRKASTFPCLKLLVGQ